MAKTRKNEQHEQKTQLESDYEFVMQFAVPGVPAPVQHEDLTQPEPYPHVRNVTTYGYTG